MPALARAALVAALLAFAPLPALSQSAPAEQSQSSGQTRLEQGQMRAMDFIERDVFTAEGREMGEVADLIIQDNRVVAAIVETENWLGLGERHVAVPMQRLRQSGGRIMTDMTADELKALPEFNYQN